MMPLDHGIRAARVGMDPGEETTTGTATATGIGREKETETGIVSGTVIGIENEIAIVATRTDNTTAVTTGDGTVITTASIVVTETENGGMRTGHPTEAEHLITVTG
jgi:hypothetical protein